MKNPDKIKLKLFNMFNGFGGNLNYIYKTENPTDGNSELRIIYNSTYDGIKYYDVLTIDWDHGSPNSIHYFFTNKDFKKIYDIDVQ